MGENPGKTGHCTRIAGAAPLIGRPKLNTRLEWDRGCATDTRLRPNARGPNPRRSCASSEATRTGPENSSDRWLAAALDHRAEARWDATGRTSGTFPQSSDRYPEPGRARGSR